MLIPEAPCTRRTTALSSTLPIAVRDGWERGVEANSHCDELRTCPMLLNRSRKGKAKRSAAKQEGRRGTSMSIDGVAPREPNAGGDWRPTPDVQDSTSPPPTLELRGISKTFPGVRALTDVSLSIWSGETHTLLGENGAGKSTLMKVLCGAVSADSGEILCGGRPARIASTADARAWDRCHFPRIFTRPSSRRRPQCVSGAGAARTHSCDHGPQPSLRRDEKGA